MSDRQEKQPLGQRLFDDVYLLLAVGLGIPIISYILWSLLELANIPAHP